jgi:hypothetical protein
MSGTDRLAGGYREARAAFCDRARSAGARLETVVHPEAGPDGEELAVDVALIGRPDAPARLAVVAGTHGVEGYAGSMCLSRFLAEKARALGDDLAAMLVHALNPYGFAWCRRVDDGNVDLNRNCIDFAAGLPANPGYDELAEALVPPRWDDPQVRAAADEALAGYAARHGFPALQAAVSAGQYRHPTGVFYGGTAPVWSQRVLADLTGRHLRGAERVAVLDLHTGLGPWGQAELIATRPDDAERARLAAWFGAYTVPSDGTSVSADVTGDILEALRRWLPGTETTLVAVEWGTVDVVTVSNALRADAWLHAHGELRSPAGARIKDELRAAFAPPEGDWAAAVTERFATVVAQATAGLRR